MGALVSTAMVRFITIGLYPGAITVFCVCPFPVDSTLAGLWQAANPPAGVMP